MTANEPYTTLNSEIVLRNPPWYEVRRDDVRFPDGSEGAYAVVERGEAVFIVPVTPDGHIILLRNYRYTIRGWLWEIPAGGVKAGIDPVDMAKQELMEEAGGTAESWENVGAFYTAPGFSDELSYIFLARGVTLGEPQRESSEVMEVHTFTLQRVLDMIRRGEMQDGPSALSILLCAPLLLNKRNGRENG